jgi:transcriptional regulator with XRE-family HTH domain
MARLRAKGLTFQQIGDKLGVTRQAVEDMLERANAKAMTVACCRCQVVIWTGRRNIANNSPTLCLTCLAKTPWATFGQRLKAVRVAAGLTLRELGEKAGVCWESLSHYEIDRSEPRWSTIEKLIRTLGYGLVSIGFPDPGRAQR